MSNGWLRNHPTAKADCDVYDLYSDKAVFHISNVPIEEFIENILGPYHLRFDLKWKLELSGDEEDPVFTFSEAGRYTVEEEFSVKEGEFKSCAVVKKYSHTNSYEPDIVYNLELKCE